MANPPSDPDWHQWRGSVTEKIDTLIREVRSLGRQFQGHEAEDDRRFTEQIEKHSALDSKVAWWSGAAAAIGSVVGWAITFVSGKAP